jgi:predicted neuraminidase/outer membrane protein assembly factor BamB
MRAFLFFFLSIVTPAQDWPEFRGPTGQGHADEREIPLTWSETQNVKWKVAIPGSGWSSPAIRGDRIWLTTATEEGKSLRAISIDRDTGALLHNIEVFRLKSAGNLNSKNSLASPTPVIEGGRVYLHFGAHGTACITESGEIVWKTRLDYDNGQHGPGGSPVIYDNLLIVSCDGQDIQFVAALDKMTGKVRWKKLRQGYQAYTTPLIVRLPAGDQVISPGALRAIAYDPRTGKELWQVRYGDGFSNVPRPVYGHGLVYICTGFQQPSLLAVRLDGRGDVTKSHIAWSLNRGVPLTPSPLLVGQELYMVSDNGIASCVDAKSGKEHWRARLGGNHSASPIYADGRIYFLSEEGQSVVIAPGKEFGVLATNQLDGPTLASMAVSNGSIFIRSQTHLYRLGLASSDPVLKTEFIFEQAPFPSSHASTIAEVKGGLVAAWFGGKYERSPDVGIWVSRFDGRGWSQVTEVANGVQTDGTRYPCWNPVLFQPREGPLLLFYKVGPNPRSWWGMMTTSADGGKSWSQPERLPDGFLGPIKNKPVQLADGSLLCGSSTETDGWVAHMERTSSLGKTWQKTAPLNDKQQFGAIQPTILVYPTGRIQILCRSRQDRITESWSEDGGKTWSAMQTTTLPNPNSGIDAVMLKDGRALLVYNHRTSSGANGRSLLNVAVSADGKTWKAALTLEDQPGEYSYPAVVQTADGLVHITYTW